jgi:hypothetical protein
MDDAVCVADLFFDSFWEPTVVGVRSGATSLRQLLFRAGGYQIDLQVESTSPENLVLIGQVTNISAQRALTVFHVMVRNHQGSSVHTATSELGEFYLELRETHDVELTLLGASRPIVIPLGDPLKDTQGLRR